MANKQTRANAKLCVSTFVRKGVNGTGDKENPQLGFKEFPFGKQPRKKGSRRGEKTVVHVEVE